MRELRRAAAAVAAMVVLAGCGPSQVERTEMLDQAQTHVADVREEALQAAKDLNPDLTFTRVHGSDRVSNCSADLAGQPRNPPTHVQVYTVHTYEVSPAQATAPLIDPIMAHFLDHGWGAGTESRNEYRRRVTVRKDGYTISMSGRHADVENRISFDVTSPCFEAPEDVDRSGLDYEGESDEPIPVPR